MGQTTPGQDQERLTTLLFVQQTADCAQEGSVIPPLLIGLQLNPMRPVVSSRGMPMSARMALPEGDSAW